MKLCVNAFKEGIDGKGGIDERLEEAEEKITKAISQLKKQEAPVDIRPVDVVYCVKLGKKFMMQYGWGTSAENGVAIINFEIDFDEFDDGSGVYIPVPIVWANDVNSYAQALAADFIKVEVYHCAKKIKFICLYRADKQVYLRHKLMLVFLLLVYCLMQFKGVI